MNPYETRKLVDEYLLFHYGTDDEVLPYADGPTGALRFAVRTVTQLVGETATRRGRALDLGCAVGRSSFELSKFCESVIGIDFSSAFIGAAERLRKGEDVAYDRLEEGDVVTPLIATAPAGSDSGSICFEVGDAMSLRDDLGVFDLVHAANLICRLPEPRRLLKRLPDLVAENGELVMTTPCTWLGEFTPPQNWPQGRTLDWLQEELDGSFELLRSQDLPFLIRETARKFQWSVAQGSVWRRV